MDLLKSRIICSLILVMTLSICLVFFIRHGKESATFYGDALGYYAYLPTTFIYHNFNSIENPAEDQGIDSIVLDYFKSNRQYSRRSPKGFYIIQYTYGIALMESPFFLGAHLCEKISGGNANGYNNTYSRSIKLAIFFYVFLGLFFLYKSLRTFFSHHVSLLSICLLLVGTNRFWFTFMQAGMSHVFLFFLYSLLIFETIQVHRLPSLRRFMLIGFICGLITVTRPSDILCVFIPLLFSVYDRTSLNEKINFLASNLNACLIGIVCFIVPIIPQLIYWKIYTGSFVYDSYIDQSFHWLHPEIIKGLFGFSNGWMAYTPLMSIAIIGLLFFKKFKPLIVPILVILPLYIYIIYAWWCYNYINGFGSRPMIHMYPLLAFPLAALLSAVYTKNKVIQLTVYSIIILLLSVNISYSFQAARGDLISENSNFLFNYSTLFKQQLTYDDLLVLDIEEQQPKSNKTHFLKTIAFLKFNDSSKGQQVYKVKADEEYPDIHVRLHYSKNEYGQVGFIRCEGRYFVPSVNGHTNFSDLVVVDIKRGDSLLLWKDVYINNKIGKQDGQVHQTTPIHLANCLTDQWGQVSFFMALPDYLQDGDEVHISLWNLSKNEFLVDDFKVDIYSK